jgi:hypothetical protein
LAPGMAAPLIHIGYRITAELLGVDLAAYGWML